MIIQDDGDLLLSLSAYMTPTDRLAMQKARRVFKIFVCGQ